MNLTLILSVAAIVVAAFAAPGARGDEAWVVYRPPAAIDTGKRVVLVSGDEEYRSEEALPQLGRILARRHGMTCTVLFPIDPATGEIDPNVQTNIPGLEALADADLMIIATRFRNLPDEQMASIDAYLRRGGPVIGMRTATHAFAIPGDRAYARYSFNFGNEAFRQGFGRQVLGETWIAHHGAHGSESTRGLIAPGALAHPVTRGIEDGDVWGPTDVYTVRLPLEARFTPLVLGEVLAGMTPDAPPVAGEKNDPMMPVAWCGTYRLPDGEEGRVFTTTMGASTDLSSEGTRRMLVNAAFWAMGMEGAIPADGTDVRVVGDYEPTRFGFNGFRKGMRPADFAYDTTEAADE